MAAKLLMPMSGSSCLVDTNIVIALLNGEKGIAEKPDKLSQVFIPAIVIGELMYGAQASTAKAKNIAKINSFVEACLILNVDDDTARCYGKIKADLKKKGTPIPENDIWIASLSIQHKLQIVTRDKHFKNISEAVVSGW